MSEPGAPAPGPRTLVFVCHGPSCSERGSPETCRLLRESLAASPARRVVRVSECGCLDSCATGPNVVVASEGLLHTGVLPRDLGRLLTLLGGPAAVG